jgi:hypothetical protein
MLLAVEEHIKAAALVLVQGKLVGELAEDWVLRDEGGNKV